MSETLEGVLAKHAGWGLTYSGGIRAACDCKEPLEFDNDSIEVTHRAHVAAAVREHLAGQREAVAEASSVAWLCQHDGSVHRRGVYHVGDEPLVRLNAALAVLTKRGQV